MSLLVRKIDYAKWSRNSILNGAPVLNVSADAITSCMRTRNNTLSLWSMDSDVEYEKAVLAIASTFLKLDTIHVVFIEPSAIEEKGMLIEKSMGETPYDEYREHHRDVISLTYQSLGWMAEVIVDCIKNDRYKRITRSELKVILKNAINTNKVSIERLNDGVKKDIS